MFPKKLALTHSALASCYSKMNDHISALKHCDMGLDILKNKNNVIYFTG